MLQIRCFPIRIYPVADFINHRQCTLELDNSYLNRQNKTVKLIFSWVLINSYELFNRCHNILQSLILFLSIFKGLKLLQIRIPAIYLVNNSLSEGLNKPEQYSDSRK